MTESDARQELERRVESEGEPALDAGEVDSILRACATLAPSSASASDGVWDLNKGEGIGWRRKQGKAAQYDGDAERRIYDHCKEMAEQAEARVRSASSTSSLPPTMSVRSSVKW